MPSNNTAVLSQQPNNRKRTATERVVPAIPLPLSKPKAPKSKSKVETDAKDGAENVTQDVPPTTSLNAQQEQLPHVVNGESAPHIDEVTSENIVIADDAVTMPAADTPGSHGSAAMSLSFGGTPEIPTTESPKPSTPPPAGPQSPMSTTSPSSSRKPSDKFDMRQIRTELPPAFVPSAEQHTPKSSTSSQFNRPLNLRTHAHTTRPSANSIVFGSQDSSTSSPAPPQSTGSAFASPTHPTFGSAQQPYFIPQGHAHHTSEPHPQRTYHAGYFQSSMPWNVRQGYGQPMPQPPMFHPHGHMPFRYPPRDIFTPPDSQQTNGRRSRSRSASQTSSAAPELQKVAQTQQSPLSPEAASDNAKMILPPEPKAAFQGQTHPRPPQLHPQMPQPQFQHPDVAAHIANAEAMRDHVLPRFSNPAFADCQLHITEDNDDRKYTFDGHRIILSRSSKLLDLFENSASPSSDALLAQVHVRLKGQYLRAKTLMDAIRYLYGGPLLQLDHQRPGSAGGEHIPSNVERMDSALQNIATGAWLKVHPIASRGVDVATGLLHWETIATALAFALDGGLSHIWHVDDGSEDRVSVSSSEDSPSRSETASSPTYDPYSTHLLQRIVEFIVHVFPINFYLNAAAPQLSACPRLPSILSSHETRASRSDPRLSQIRFGDIPVEDHQRPSFATTTVSSVLLSLPFQILKCVLEHYELTARLGPETVASIMRQVIAEREARRVKVLNARMSSQSNDNADPQLVQNLFWEEYVETSVHHRAGSRLARRKRGIDTPPSSGACSERNK